MWDENGVNVTLQSAAEIITNSMNELSTTGALVRDVDTNEVSKQYIFVLLVFGFRGYIFFTTGAKHFPRKISH